MRILLFSLFNIPSRCIRQLESFDTMNSAPVSKAEAHFTSAMAVEIIGNFVAKAPPKPQQVSASCISTNSSPRTWRNNSRAGFLFPSSLKPWHPSWKVILAGNFAPRSVTPSFVTGNQKTRSTWLRGPLQPFHLRSRRTAPDKIL